MKKAIFSLYILSFVNTLNFTIVIPILPYILKEYGGTWYLYGLLIAIYPLFQFYAAPILGSLSDYYGRRPILLLSQAGTLLSWLIFFIVFFVPNVSLGFISLPLLILLLSRAADGATGGNNAVANAYASDFIPQNERTNVYGILGGISGIAIIIGPILGGLAMTDLLGYLGPVLLAMSVSLFALIYMYLFMPESLEKDKRVKKLDLNILKEMQFIPKLKTYTENRVMKYILIKRVSFLLVFSSFSSIFILYLVDVLKLTSQEIGYFFVIIGLMIVFNQIFIVGSLSKKLGNYKSLMTGLIMVTFAQILLGLSANLWYFFSVLYLNSLGVAMAIPTFKSLLSEHVEHDKQGEIMGLDESLVSATSVVAPLISTWLYQDLGPSVFVLQGILLLLVLFIYFKRKGWLLRGGHK